jgi:tol-pal system protein YbgF
VKATETSQAVRIKTGAIYGPRFVLACAFLLIPTLGFAQGDNRNSAVVQAELFMQLEQLQAEVQSLRNKVEKQEQTLSRMQDEQRRRYIDLDERLQDHNKRVSKLEEAKIAPVEAPVATSVTESPASSGSSDSGNKAQPSAREAYSKAYQLVPERQFDEAIQAFQDFIRKYPDSQLVGNGYYWIGEIHMAQNRTREAEKMFEAVVRRYPGSFKVADSKYKLGLISSRYGNEDQAKEIMQSIIAEYPREPAAELARTWLNR